MDIFTADKVTKYYLLNIRQIITINGDQAKDKKYAFNYRLEEVFKLNQIKIQDNDIGSEIEN